MRYNEIFIISILILSIVLILKFIHSSINIIMVCDVNNSDINIKLNIKYLFNLINIKIPIYPHKEKSDKDKKERKRKERNTRNKINIKAIKIKDIKTIFSLIFKIKIGEIYSDINIGNNNVSLTSFTYIFINNIYGNIINIVQPEKIYLNITPNFTQNYIRANIKLHIKPTIKDIITIFISIIKIYRKIKVNKKDGGISEINRVNTKYYGKNI